MTTESNNEAQRGESAAQSATPTRRTFLTGAGAAALASLTAAACATDEPAATAPEQPTPAAPSQVSAPTETTAVTEVPPTAPPELRPGRAAVPFHAASQQGVLLAPAAAGVVAAFEVLATDRDGLAETLQTVSTEIERLMTAAPSGPDEDFLPPNDSGALGPESTTAGTAVTLAVGASLFDDRFDLADKRPAELIAMPRFFNDRLVREELSHGDLSVTISAPTQQAAVFALHQLVRVSKNRLRLRWVQEGYNELLPPSPDRVAPTRNLMGFRDGTSNLDTTDDATMNEHVWVQPSDREPEWAAGGTYQAVRIIRMLIEFWATAALIRQEQIFGRHRESGAPLGQTTEAETPLFAENPADQAVPARSHMRLANPRTPGTGRILRRGFSYLNGIDSAAELDQGLLFLAYQRSLNRGFLAAQSRLDGEPLEDYIKPVGGGLFFVLPGPGPSGDGWLGESLLS